MVAAGGDGGGDIDLAVGFGNSALTANPILAFSSLIVANLSTEIPLTKLTLITSIF